MRTVRDSHEEAVLSLLVKRFRTDYSKGDLTVAPDPNSYSDPSAFSKDYLLYNYKRKSLTGTSASIVEDTFASWLKAEKQCFSTNQRLNKVVRNDFFDSVRLLIEDVIGVSPPSSLLNSGHWSAGATSLTKRGVHWSNKMNGTVAVTDSASALAPFYFAGLSGYGFGEFTINRTNRAVQVPKTAKINRMISCENAANSFMQHSVGRHIRDRLLRVGIDLRNQCPNQQAAFAALADDLATIDLSMASDTLAFSLVQHVLPHEWFVYLCKLRSQFTLVNDGKNDRTFFLEKFSSMGNAFTFELETLIFWAIAKSVAKEPMLLVYGDDIICHQSDSKLVIQALEYCGFIVNWDKSFSSGLFFESCGKHYHSLEDVSPIFQKEIIDETDIMSVYRAHNRLYRWGLRNSLSLVHDACNYLKSLLPRKYQLMIPVCERDDALISASHPFRRDPHGDYLCKVLRDKPKVSEDVNYELCLGFCLKTGRHAEQPNGHFANRSDPRGLYKIRSVTIWNTALNDVSQRQFEAGWSEDQSVIFR